MGLGAFSPRALPSAQPVVSCPDGGMVDTRDLKSLALLGVRVRVPLWVFAYTIKTFVIESYVLL